MKENRSKAMALLVTLLMIGSVLVVMAPTATKATTTATKTDVPEATVLPGQENVVVLNFTVSEDGTDEFIAGNPQPGKKLTYGIDSNWTSNGMYFYDNGSNIWEATSDAIWIDDGNVYYDDGEDTPLNGTTTENTGPGSTTNPWSDVYFYDDGDNTWEEDSDAIWLDNGSGSYESSADTLIAGTAPADGTSGTTTNPWSDVYFYDDGDNTWEEDSDAIWLDDGNVYYDNGKDTHVAGVQTENLLGQNSMPPGWDLKSYDASDGDAWNDSADMIVFEDDDNDAYGDAITGVTISNEGTADATDIDTIKLYMEEGTTPGFQADEDTLIGTFTLGGSWTCDLSSSPITLWDESKTFYVVADISGLARGGKTLKFNISAGGITVNSTDTVPREDLLNENSITIGKLGVDYFEGTEEGAVDVIATDTKELKYGATVNLGINTSCLTNGDTYYLYYPCYKRAGSGGSYTYYIKWKPYMIAGGAEQASITADGDVQNFAESIYFNVSGMWILDDDNNPTDAAERTDTDFAYFWVNGSEVYDISLSTDKVYYGKNETITITVTEGGSAAGVWIDVRRESDGSLVFHKWAGDGTVTFNSDWLNNLTYAGNYTVFAYRDIDATIIGYGTEGYSEDYGYTDPSISADNYSAICGPWDPPEKVSKVAKIVVETGKPQLEIPEINKTMYWSFPGEVKIYTKGYDGENLTFSSSDVKVYNSEGDDVTSHLTINTDTGVIKISSDSWGKEDGTVWGTNGTWKVVVSYDKPTADGTEEWNGTVTFTVTSAPDVQIKILNPEDKEIKAVPCDPENPFFDLRFSVINKNHESLGGEGGEEAEKAKENITIYGDVLFIGEEGKTLAEYEEMCPFAVNYIPPSDGNDGIWSVKIIPLMDINGGEIKIKVNWENTTKEETVQVGGTKLNGTIVTITPSEFTIDENVTLTVKVTDASGYAYPNANVTLYYFDNETGDVITENTDGDWDYINNTLGGGTTSGEYTFLFNTTQQTDWQTSKFGFTEIKAPRYILVAVNVSNVGCGYAYAVMKPRSDLKVEVSRDTFMAGKPYHFWINVSKIDPITGNKTGTPSDSGLYVRIYNETGADVTDDIGSLSTAKLDGSASIELSSEYFTEPGTYYIYAYNNTHDSEGFNATIYVVPVEVTCDKSELIWNYDDNISLTFTVKWQGENVGNGTLRIYNISQDGGYYKAWSEGDYKDLTLTNGVVTLHNVTANFLPEGKGLENITFEYKPEGASEFAKAEGILPVKVPDVEPTPDMVAVGETATVNVLVTGRGQPLSGVNVTLKGAGINLTAATGANGIANFAFLPSSTGTINILIENRTTGVSIEVTAHTLEIDVPPSVQEGIFTVTVKDENGNPVAGAQVKFTGTGETKTTNSNGEVSFNISIPGTIPYATYKLIATKPGYRSAEESVTVVNMFNLYISVPSKASPGQKITVKVTSDAGQVYGVTITLKKGTEVIETKTLTGPEGVSFTIPQVKEKTTFTIVAEKEGYKSATYEITVTPGGIPGFELVTLIAAIGVAFVLLRRRQQ